MADHDDQDGGEPISEAIKDAAGVVCETFSRATVGMTADDKKSVIETVYALIGFELADGDPDAAEHPDASKLTPEEKAVIFTMGVLHELHAQRVLSRGDDSEGLTPKGFDLYAQLKAAGYKSVEEEMRLCLIEWLRKDEPDTL